MRKFETEYRIRPDDVVATKEDQVHQDLDRRLDVVERQSSRVDLAAREVIDRATRFVSETLAPRVEEIDQKLADYRDGVPAAAVQEDAERRFVSDLFLAALAEEMADLMASLALAAPRASPGLTGTPTAPTAAPATNTTQIATTAFVQAVVTALKDFFTNGAGAALDQFNELAAALGNDANFATTITTALANRLRFDATQSLSAAQAAQGKANLGVDANETTIASAATTDIGASNTDHVLITGTTTITSFGTQTRRRRFVRFAGALTLTHNNTSLILPGAANLTVAAGDTAALISDASGNWRLVGYFPAPGVMKGADPGFSGALTGPTGSFTTAVNSPRHAVDPWFYLAFSGVVPLFAFDVNDYLSFDRATNTLSGVIGGVNVFSTTADTIFRVPALAVAGRRVYGPQPIAAAASGVTFTTTETSIVELTFTATGATLLATAKGRVSNSGSSVNVIYALQLFDLTSGTLNIYNITTEITAVGGSSGTAPYCSAVVDGGLVVGRSYLCRMTAKKQVDNGGAAAVFEARIDGINL